MSSYIKVKAKQLDVLPAVIAGEEHKGALPLTSEDSPVIGAQCGHCQTVIWCDQRNSRLNRQKPDSVPDWGPLYTAWYESKLSAFMSALPECPECHSTEFNRFINNAIFPRFSDGSLLDLFPGIKFEYLDASEFDVWYLNGT